MVSLVETFDDPPHGGIREAWTLPTTQHWRRQVSIKTTPLPMTASSIHTAAVATTSVAPLEPPPRGATTVTVTSRRRRRRMVRGATASFPLMRPHAPSSRCVTRKRPSGGRSWPRSLLPEGRSWIGTFRT